MAAPSQEKATKKHISGNSFILTSCVKETADETPAKPDHGNGADFLYGSLSSDTLIGGAGTDELYGGTGADVLIGGADADTFVQIGFFGDGDVITDFQRGIDKIAVSSSAASSLIDILLASTNVSGDTLVDFGTNQSFTIENIRPGELVLADFIFV